MCMMVYVGSDEVLPRRPWTAAHPALCVEGLQESQRAVMRHFTKPQVCYVGAHEGCGCGFQSSDDPDDDEAAELAAARESRAQLAALLRAALQFGKSAELFACWNGDEGCDPVYVDTLVPEELLGTKTHFREREFLTVIAQR